jgi:hypothetical protein
MSAPVIRRASRTESRLRLAIMGPAGSGKTYTALRVARLLVGDGRVIVIDSERGSAELYADEPDIAGAFDTIDLDSYHPQAYIDAIKAADDAGAAVIIVDSLTHAWSGEGGALTLVDQAQARAKSCNSFTAWRDVTPLHNRLVDALLGTRAHIVVTLRTKTEYVLEEDSRGKKVPRKVGLAPVQRDGLEYEFTIVGDMDIDHRLVVTKSRCAAVADAVFVKPGEEFVAPLRAWLAGAHAAAPAAPTQPEDTRDVRAMYDAAATLGGEDRVKALLKAAGFTSLNKTTADAMEEILWTVRETQPPAAPDAVDF